MTRAALSRAVNINQGTLANYENEIRQADYKTLILLADFFDISVDELLGRGAIADNNRAAQLASDFGKPLTKAEKKLILDYRELSLQNRDVISHLAENLK